MPAKPQPSYLWHVPSGIPNAPVLVVLPGVNSGPYLFKQGLPLLGGSHRLLLVNPPDGTQFPFSVVNPLTAKRYAEMVLGYLEKAVPGFPDVPLAVLGHSLGGYAAQELVRLLPRRPSHLVLVSTSMGQPDTAYDMARMSKALGKSFWQYSKELEQNPAEHFHPMFGPGFAMREKPIYMDFLADRAAYLPSKAASLAQLGAGGTFSSAGWASGLVCPTLVVHGGADILVSPLSGRKLAKTIPTARYLEFYNVGHFPMLEHAGFYPAVHRFLLGHPEGEELDRVGQGLWGKIYQRFLKLHG